jgi:hypothetical protein
MTPPKKAKLTSDEIFVAPEFDESGLMFYLVFNKKTNHLYWILNEDNYVPEHYHDIGDSVIIGDRTEFAFYVDQENNRKILIGVDGFSTIEDDYYDGPFDQMPDNLVKAGKLDLQKYLHLAYPGTKGAIDRYGNYLKEPGVRVAVAPYLIYFSRDDVLSTVRDCKSTSPAASDFYACITQPVFNIPAEIKDCDKEGVDYKEPPPTRPADDPKIASGAKSGDRD